MHNDEKIGAISLPGDDDKRFPQSQVKSQGSARDVIIIYPYGMHANAPVGSAVLLSAIQGNEDNEVGQTFNEDDRPKNLEEDEVIFGNFVIGSTIHFKENGDIAIICKNDETVTIDGNCTVNIAGNSDIDIGGTANITSTGNMTLKAPEITADGNLTVTGTLDVTGATTLAGVTAGGKNIGSTHTHTGVTTGVGTSGPPT